MDPAFEEPAHSRQQIMDKLTYWREHLVEVRSGQANVVVTEREALAALDKWLDELSDLRGR